MSEKIDILALKKRLAVGLCDVVQAHLERTGEGQKPLSRRATGNEQSVNYIVNADPGDVRLPQFHTVVGLALAIGFSLDELAGTGPHALAPREQKLVERYRGMTEDQRTFYDEMGDGLLRQSAHRDGLAEDRAPFLPEGVDQDRRVASDPDHPGPERRKQPYTYR